MKRLILEHAVLEVIAGREDEFEAAFDRARTLIANQAGFRSMRLERCIETSNRYLLLVEWDTIDDHVQGFRSSEEYETWRSLLHEFYDPFPLVEHYENVLEQQPTSR